MSTFAEDKRAYWSAHLSAFKQSGLSQQAYCQEHKIKANTLWYWRRKLKPESSSPSLSVSDEFPSPAFIPVVQSDTSGSVCVEIQLLNGLRIQGVTQETLPWIQTLVTLLS